MAELDAIATALSGLKEDEAKRLIHEQMEAGAAAGDILGACQAGLAQVGKRFETGEYFISELMYAGEIMKDIMADLQPHLGEIASEDGGARTVVFGTVKGDIHDIGKDVCVLMLRGAGYEVVDLGVDVAPRAFAEAAAEHDAFLVGMSVFLTTCCRAIDQTVAALKDSGLREKVQVIIGGAAASDFVAERTGCDAFGRTAVDAVSLAAEAAQ
jgi:5-methyltetrahydrofolate--homocysteine methyltransferase